MARKKIGPDAIEEIAKTEISYIAENYIDAKAEEKKIKEVTADLNKKLKKYFEEADNYTIHTDNGSVKYSIRESDVFDEESLIELFKSNPETSGLVKTKEYVDFSDLESALYNEKLSEDMVKAIRERKSVKRTPVITIGK